MLHSHMGRSSAIDEMIQHVATKRDGVLCLVLAFDGVLIDYLRDPATASLSRGVRDALRHLTRRSAIALGVVSGRRLDDLRQGTGLGDIAYPHWPAWS